MYCKLSKPCRAEKGLKIFAAVSYQEENLAESNFRFWME